MRSSRNRIPLVWPTLFTLILGAARLMAEAGPADEDLMGLKELAAGLDPTFESVSRHLPAMKHPREIVGVKDHPHDIGIAEDGSLQLSDNITAKDSPVAFFEVGSPPARFGSGDARCEKRLLDGYLPIVIAEAKHDGVAYEQTVFGYSEGLSADQPLFAYVRLKTSNLSPAGRTVDVSFRTQAKGDAGTSRRWKLEMGPNGERAVYLKVPFDLSKGGPAEPDAAGFDRHLAEASGYWKELLARGTQIRVPEQRINDAHRAWLAYNFLDVDKRDGVYQPCDGAGFYEEVYGYSAALYCHALDLMGLHDIARVYLESLFHFQREDGLFYINFGLPDTGAFLFALAQHYRLTGDADWLRSVAGRMLRMCDWIIRSRKAATMQGSPGRPVTYGLIRFRPYCDYRQPAYDYFSDTYLCVGLEEAASVLAQIGMTKQADGIKAQAAGYRRDILASMEAAVFDLDGMKVLPLEPVTHRILKESKNQANGYYSLIAPCVLENDFLPASGPLARCITAFLERKRGLILGMSRFQDGVDHAYTYGYWMNCLERDLVEPVILGFYGSLAYGMTRETYSAVEVTWVAKGDNMHTLPHLYSNTQQLRLFRNMLLREDGEDLIIGQAIPRHWLAPGKRIDVVRAPTAFGPTSFTIESEANRGRLTVFIEPPVRKAPRSIKVRLRHPERLPILGVDAKYMPQIRFERETVTLANVREPIRVEVRYR
jgi:hypothetical protein